MYIDLINDWIKDVPNGCFCCRFVVEIMCIPCHTIYLIWLLFYLFFFRRQVFFFSYLLFYPFLKHLFSVMCDKHSVNGAHFGRWLHLNFVFIQWIKFKFQQHTFLYEIIRIIANKFRYYFWYVIFSFPFFNLNNISMRVVCVCVFC